MKNIFILFALLVLILTGCVTNKDKKAVEKPADFEGWILHAQEMTNRGKYTEAINILNEALTKFPDVEVLAVNYNVGYNYYKFKKYDDAKRYFNRVINIFESNASTRNQDEVNESRKFVILSGLMLDRIQKDFEAMKDPYHIREEIKDKEPKKVSPKKK